MSDALLQQRRYRIWMLNLVPSIRHGRWWAAAAIFVLLATLFWQAGVFTDSPRADVAWAAALFFCVILAYIVPILHFITEHTELAFDELAPNLACSVEQRQAWRRRIATKRPLWFVLNLGSAVLMWIVQTILLWDGRDPMAILSMGGFYGFMMTVGPLLVWVCVTTAIHALVDNARLFRRLHGQVRLNLLDVQRFTPFGRMAVSSTLVVIGAQASFAIMWLGAVTDPWTTIPGMVVTTLALLFLFFATVWPVHRRLQAAKRAELARLQTQINALSDPCSSEPDYGMLQPILNYRREIGGMSEWPFDLSVVARLGLYLIVVPLTWIGAALIENVVDLFVR